MFPRWSLCVLTVATSFAGCADSQPAPAAPATATSSHAGGAATEMMPTYTAADQAMITKQEICPVGGEKLGSMGQPVRVTSGDRVVFLCCKGCVEAFEKEPAKYLAKLDSPAGSPADVSSAATTEAGTPAAPAEAPAAPETPVAPPATEAATATPAPEVPANP